MKLAAYLYLSRHGVFYFRWPVSNGRESRQTVRISLKTRCPKRAGLLARHLASCGEALRSQALGSTMRYDELKSCVEAMLRESLRKTLARLDTKGPLHNYNAAAEEDTKGLLAAGPEDYWDIVGPSEVERTLDKIAAFAGRPRSEIEENQADALELFRVGQLAYWDAVAQHRKTLQKLDLLTVAGQDQSKDGQEKSPIGAAEDSGATLEETVAAYVREHAQMGVWVERTRAKQEATLGVLVELLGAATKAAVIGKQHAQDVKAVVMTLPANKNKNPKTRNLSLRDAAKVEGVPKLSPETVNAYLGAFYTFFDWATKNGYTKEKLFDGMKVRTKRAASTSNDARAAFSMDAISKMVEQLTRPNSTLVKKDCYRWASLIGIFTGARLNEVCGLRASDVQEHNGILCISINEEDPDHKKRLKTAAALRLVPVHSQLIEHGFIAFVAERKSFGADAKLFPDFAYSPKHGFGRNQGRWFNETFLPALGLKTDQLVFHSLRHTMVTRLHQANVPQPLVQTIVGHEREGVTMKTYFGEGYTVEQLKDAIENFQPTRRHAV